MSGKLPPGTPANAFDYLNPPEGPGELGRLGPYRIKEVIGIGGMGTVFRAEDPSLRRTVALKVMLPSVATNATAKARFLREARAQAAVEHDHVIAIHQVGEDRGIPYLAMPLLKGQPLGVVLKATPRMPINELMRIGREMAEGLAAAHEKGLVHRDIKPGNVWLEGNRQRVKILDFGLARSTEPDNGLMTSEEPVTKAGAAVGTPAYMSPEQARGLDVDHRTDLFSLGVVMYQMATGELPFRGADVMAVLTALAMTEPAAPISRNPELPQAVNDLILRLLAKKPENRPADGEAVAEELRQMEHSLLHQAAPAPATAAPPAYAPYPTPAQVPAFPAPAPHPGQVSNDPWSDIDATDTGVVIPPLNVPGANSSKLDVPASSKTAPHAPAAKQQATREAAVSASGVHGRTPKKNSMMIVLIAGGIAAFVLVAGLGYLAYSMVAVPKGTVVMESPDNPEVVVLLKGEEGEFQVKAGETAIPSGDYNVEISDQWRRGYRASTTKLNVPPKGRTDLKIRAIAPPKPKEKPPT
jgi:serine/threonine protein kinase